MKKLKDLTEKEYKKLIKADLLQVLYPEVTGDYVNDCTDFYRNYKKSKFKNGYWVKVIKGGNNASDFNKLIGVNGRGVYDLVGWETELFRIDGDIKKFNGEGYVDNQYCYPLKWNDHYAGYVYEKALESATPSEIEAHLIEEAKRRGYKQGVVVKSFHNRNTWALQGDVRYIEETDSLSDRMTYLYQKGKWAEIIKEEKIKIGGYEVEFKKGEIKVGCKYFTNYMIKCLDEVSKFCKSTDNVITVNTYGDILLSDDIHSILKKSYQCNKKDLEKLIEKLQD
jgi:hypothetical protein